jgi:hypothetical protein
VTASGDPVAVSNDRPSRDSSQLWGFVGDDFGTIKDQLAVYPDIEATFSQKGGARVGWKNITWPYAILSGGCEALRLSCFGQDYVFHKSKIEGLSKFRGMISVGLQIDHTVPLYPEFIVFWISPIPWTARPFERLKTRLESLGYQVLE